MICTRCLFARSATLLLAVLFCFILGWIDALSSTAAAQDLGAAARDRAADAAQDAAKNHSKKKDNKKSADKNSGDKKASEKKDADKKDKQPEPEDEELARSQHSARIGGERLRYSAKVGRLELRDDKGKPRANVYYFAYLKKNPGELAKRPITFAFNGGPGSASVWLHLGIAGPARVKLNDDATPSPPPYQYVPNEHSLLDLTDVVLIDPVSTGLSRVAESGEAKKFHGYEGDIQSIGEFIERYLSTQGRWQSPKYLIGESYGTTRAAGLAENLFDRHGVALNGIVMVSSVLNFGTINFQGGNDLPYVVFLPSYTAAAWYHNRLDEELQEDLERTLREAERFASGQYSVALFKGDALAENERRRIVRRIARYTGLSREFIQQSNLRVSMWEFAKEMMRDERRTVGRFDSRYVGIDRQATGSGTEYDPSAAALFPAYTAAFNTFLRSALNYGPHRKYNIFGEVHPWNFSQFTNRYVDASEPLRKTMHRNPHMRVFVASGYYDLATPYFASDWTFRQLQLDESLRKNITYGYYKAGHMMYIHSPSLKKLKHDLAEFYGE